MVKGNPNHDQAGKFASGNSSKYDEIKAIQQKLDKQVTEVSKTLNSFPKGAMGMTPEGVKIDPKFQQAKAEFNSAFSKLRQVNEHLTKNFKKEEAASRQAKRAGRFSLPVEKS